MDNFNYPISEVVNAFAHKLFTAFLFLRRIRIGCFFRLVNDFISSLKEQSLVREMKVYSHLKALRIAPGNWGKVGAA